MENDCIWTSICNDVYRELKNPYQMLKLWISAIKNATVEKLYFEAVQILGMKSIGKYLRPFLYVSNIYTVNIHPAELLICPFTQFHLKRFEEIAASRC